MYCASPARSGYMHNCSVTIDCALFYSLLLSLGKVTYILLCFLSKSSNWCWGSFVTCTSFNHTRSGVISFGENQHIQDMFNYTLTRQERLLWVWIIALRAFLFNKIRNTYGLLLLLTAISHVMSCTYYPTNIALSPSRWDIYLKSTAWQQSNIPNVRDFLGQTLSPRSL